MSNRQCPIYMYVEKYMICWFGMRKRQYGRKKRLDHSLPYVSYNMHSAVDNIQHQSNNINNNNNTPEIKRDKF